MLHGVGYIGDVDIVFDHDGGAKAIGGVGIFRAVAVDRVAPTHLAQIVQFLVENICCQDHIHNQLAETTQLY